MLPMDVLRLDGYFYSQTFAESSLGAEAAASLAVQLGKLSYGTVCTEPSPTAPATRPFDKQEALGWHNDFTTHVHRPRFSLSFIERQDPSGSPWGNWKVARVRDVLDVLAQSPEGREVLGILLEPHPFEFDGQVFSFPVLTGQRSILHMRFYGDGLRRGYAIQRGTGDKLSAITAVENAADECAVELVATTGALLIVDNRLSLHYRREQTVKGVALRRARLLFAS